MAGRSRRGFFAVRNAHVFGEGAALLRSPFSNKHERRRDDEAGEVCTAQTRHGWFSGRVVPPAEPPKRCRAYACHRSPKRRVCGRGFTALGGLFHCLISTSTGWPGLSLAAV